MFSSIWRFARYQVARLQEILSGESVHPGAYGADGIRFMRMLLLGRSVQEAADASPPGPAAAVATAIARAGVLSNLIHHALSLIMLCSVLFSCTS